MRHLLFPWGYPYVVPSDDVGHEVARLLITPSATRDRLTACCHLPANAEEPVGALEWALSATLEAEGVEARMREAHKAGRMAHDPRANVRDMAEAALAAGVITPTEHALLQRRNELRDRVIRVDDFENLYSAARHC